MPELPDIEVYLRALRERIVGSSIEKVRVPSAFVVRTYAPPIRSIVNRRVERLLRVGKRVVLSLDGELFVVIHLMIAGRLRWEPTGAKIPRKLGLCAFDFAEGCLLLTEAGSKKRASIHVVEGQENLNALDPGGIEVLDSKLADFSRALTTKNHTIKRALTDPRILSGIGNAYSDEILHAAELSPIKWTSRLSEEELARLHEATQAVLRSWIDRLDIERKSSFPKTVTALRPDMAGHGRYEKPCPRCQSPVQRIRRANSEVNYCPPCQTGGKLLADRGLSRLLRGDWPKTLEELEALKKR